MHTQAQSSTPKVESTEDENIVSNNLKQVISVRKQNGDVERFSVEKLSTSLKAVLLSAGLTKNIDFLVSKIQGYVVTRLNKNFDGHTVPSTSEVREIVQLTLIDQNLTHVAKRYLTYHLENEKNAVPSEPVYDNGLKFERYFTTLGMHPFDEIEWEHRAARITNEKGDVIFEQEGIEVPKSWSQTATNIVVQKYFVGKLGAPDRETSVKQIVTRVASTIANWGRKDGYFASAEDAKIFEMELTHILADQKASFNSPVWFNIGVSDRLPQASACFINSVEDDMRSILQLAMTEGMLFKYGSGTGSNLSTLRSSRESLAGSPNKSSGPVSFMKAYDAIAGVVKSGGKTRRAAKMVILNVEHPDILDFVECKAKEERKAWALMDAGYDGSINGEAYQSVSYQNANHSVRVTDEFMQAVVNDADWWTRYVTTGQKCEKYRAHDIMRKISEAAWQCGDPGIQADTTINKWHTAKNTGRINASNPCSEFMYLDDTACNLASLNLMKFRKEDGEFDAVAFKSATETLITSMEILVGNSSYPTPAIEQNSILHRPLGIGYANLGALIMARGLPYDSDEGRNFATAITSLLSGAAYAQSARLASKIGSFAEFEKNKEPMMEVMEMHRKESRGILSENVSEGLLETANKCWDEVVELGNKTGIRNAQISVLAPTGTIAFMMDCDTTGIEPDIALVKYKWLVGGGMIKMVNNTVPEALARLGYTGEQIDDILAYINAQDTIEGAPHLQEKHLPVFDCAFKPQKGKRSIHYMGHVRMMAAVQPFISGAISKTVNLPQEATVEDIMDVYIESWKLGLKAVAIYRDGSKRQQAVTTSTEQDQKKIQKEAVVKEVNTPRRRRLPDERRSITHKFSIGGHEGYATVGLYDDGTPGEIFITMSKEGSVISGLMDAFATAISISLQYGVPLKTLVNKFVHMRFEPSGFTGNPSIKIAKSIVDYLFRWLALKFLSIDDQRAVGLNVKMPSMEEVVKKELEEAKESAVADLPNPTAPQATIFDAKKDDEGSGNALAGLVSTFNNSADAPICYNCGGLMVRNGTCYKCLNCGETSGCS